MGTVLEEIALELEQTAGKAAPGSAVVYWRSCAIDGIFSLNGRMGVCGHHGTGNTCFSRAPCEHTQVLKEKLGGEPPLFNLSEQGEVN